MDPDTTQAPDGASTPAPTDLIPRAEALRAFEQRDMAKARARELEAEVERLRNPPKPEAKPEQGKAGDISEFAKALQLLQEQNAALLAEVRGEKKQKQRAAVVDSILSRVPAHNRDLAATVVDGLVARGTISLDGEDTQAIVDTAAKHLHTHATSLFAVGGSSASAIQAGPDGRIDWSSVKSKADVPPGEWANVPDEVYRRLEPSGSSGAALKIRGGR